MNETDKRPENCLCGGCYQIGMCKRCGFDKTENERRKKLPLVKCSDGLMRKIIPAKYREYSKKDKGDQITNAAQ